MAVPSKESLQDTLNAAGSAHHEFETNYLNGEYDTQWSGWYAAFVIGRLGEFTTPTQLTRWLEQASTEGNWAENAAEIILDRLR